MLALSDIMTKDVVTLEPEATLRDAVELLSSEGVTGAPVVAGDGVVGVVSVTDLMEFQVSNPGVPTSQPGQTEWGEWQEGQEGAEGAEGAEPGDGAGAFFLEFWDDAGADVLERFEGPEGPEWDVLEEHTVAEIMSRSLHALPPGTEVPDAARYMVDRRIHRVLVTEGRRLVGIVTATDIMRAVADRRL